MRVSFLRKSEKTRSRPICLISVFSHNGAGGTRLFFCKELQKELLLVIAYSLAFCIFLNMQLQMIEYRKERES